MLPTLARLLLLLAGHALCDYPLQGDFLARGKNRTAPIAGIPWWQCLTAHALIHAGMVYLVTRSLWFALAELVIHWLTDYSRCEGWFGSGSSTTNARAFNIDQAIHVACKIAWAFL